MEAGRVPTVIAAPERAIQGPRFVPLRTAAPTRRAMLQAMAGATLAGCGAGSAAPVENRVARPATVSFSFWGSQERADLVARELVPLFKSRQPQIEVQLVHNPDNYKQKLVTMFAGGTP